MVTGIDERALHVLENEYLRVVISNAGAELQSIYSKRSGREWLWQGDQNYWGKRSPLLFPFVGTCKDGTYSYENITYAMPRHGFVRDMTFVNNNHDDQYASVSYESKSVSYELNSDHTTLERYPFEFGLEVTYEIKGSRLDVGFRVMNKGARQMFFSIGGHPAFNADMDKEEWNLVFSECEEDLELIPIEISTGLLVPKTVPWSSRVYDRSVTDGRTAFRLKKEIFEEDALIFSHLSSEYTELRADHLDEGLRFHHGQFPFMAFWSPRAPFVCMEPWFGHADYQDHDGALTHKSDAVMLESGDTFEATYAIELMGM